MDARDPEAHDSTAHPAKPYDINPYDIKKDHAALYAPRAGGFHVVEVPELSFLMVDGHGDPNVSHAYAEAVQALFALSYAVRATAKRELGRVHTVGPLEGLWSAEDPRAFVAGDKSAWDWTMMITQPAWITPEIVETASAPTTPRRPSLPGCTRSTCPSTA